jgi:exfoliative toxin A/B
VPNFLAKQLQSLPIGILGLAFGVCSLGWSFEIFYPLNGYLQALTTSIALIVICLVSLKLFLLPKSFYQLQLDPAIGPILPTIAMTLMVASTCLSPLFSLVVWGIGLILHLIILCCFIFSRITNFTLAQVSPTWFIPTIGIVVAPLTASIVFLSSMPPTISLLNSAILVFAILAYFSLFPMVVYRLRTLPSVNSATKPALALFSAPPNICLAGYLALTAQPNATFTVVMICLAIIMTCFSYYTIIKQKNDTFVPTIGAFTFPLIIGAAAMRETADWIQSSNGDFQFLHSVFSSLAQAQFFIATLTTLWVCYRYLLFLKNTPNLLEK